MAWAGSSGTNWKGSMKFNPGDLAWLRYWFDDWDGCAAGWRLAIEGGKEVVMTIVEAPIENGFDLVPPDDDHRVLALVIDHAGREITMPLAYLVDEREAQRMRSRG